MIEGPDFSHWQAKVSTDKLKVAGMAFAIVKAGEVYIKIINKPAVKDSMHDRNIAELKRAGLICGDYYYFHPSAGASKQARHYAAIRKTNPPNLPPIIDIEDSDGMKPADVGNQLLVFMAELQTLTGEAPWVYSRNGFLVNDCGNPDWPAGTMFWIARYSMTIGDLSPKIKPNVVMWQHTKNLKIPGCPEMDGNLWLRSMDELWVYSGKYAEETHPIEIARIKLGIYKLSQFLGK